MTPDKQEYGSWLQGEFPRFSHREGLGRGASSRDFSSSEPRREMLPVRSSGVAVHDKPNMENLEITPSAMRVGIIRYEDNRVGLETGEPNGPNVDPSGPQGPNRKSLGSTWKRIVRASNHGPTVHTTLTEKKSECIP
ncbi:hypothetical protein FCV25MIE_07616 [Fagus crenata]